MAEEITNGLTEAINKLNYVGEREGDLLQGTKQVYSITRIVGNGSFGVVYKATSIDRETIAIKRVLQDNRFKNRELEIMARIRHCNIVELYDAFMGEENDRTYLYLVLEFVPETAYRVTKNFHRLNASMPYIFIKLYIYQLARAVNYLHKNNICHRDIKPHNLLVNQQQGILKLCDFGSAKCLGANEESVAYICSRFYRAPELIFGATRYTTAIDVWSIGCVFAEMILGEPLFMGEDQVDQLVQIIHVLGTPTQNDILSMNPEHVDMQFHYVEPDDMLNIIPHPDACDLLERMLVYNPTRRISPLEICAHPFFDDLRNPDTRLPNGGPLPDLFDFTMEELRGASVETLSVLIHPENRGRFPPTMFSHGNE